MSVAKGGVLTWLRTLDDWLSTQTDCPVSAATARAIAAKRVLCADGMTGANCAISQEAIAARLHVNRKSVRKFDHYLIEHGWMFKVKSHGRGRFGTTYSLTVPLNGPDETHSTLNGSLSGSLSGSHGTHNLLPPTDREEEGGVESRSPTATVTGAEDAEIIRLVRDHSGVSASEAHKWVAAVLKGRKIRNNKIGYIKTCLENNPPRSKTKRTVKTEGQVPDAGSAGKQQCGYCETRPATVTVKFPDGYMFDVVCDRCLDVAMSQMWEAWKEESAA
jgi:hypothetical protein